MTRRNGLIALIMVAAVVLASGALLLLSRGTAPQSSSGDMVIIQVDGAEYGRFPLSHPQTVTVRQDNGAENVIEIDREGAVMRSSTCENQLCVHMGKVTVDNWEWRVNGAFIICLPNRVSVELVPSADNPSSLESVMTP